MPQNFLRFLKESLNLNETIEQFSLFTNSPDLRDNKNMPDNALKKRTTKILDILEKEHPNAKLVLNFKNPLELLVATILAAQCRDVLVNEVTELLFKKYKTPEDYAKANPAIFENEVSRVTFYQNKAKYVLKAAKMLVEKFESKVPQTVEELVELPGVGRKTANIVLSNAMNIPAIGADTHLIRLSQRIGFTKHKDPDKIEADLCALIPRERWLRATHVIGWHGREICQAKKPLCEKCKINSMCDYYKNPK